MEKSRVAVWNTEDRNSVVGRCFLEIFNAEAEIAVEVAESFLAKIVENPFDVFRVVDVVVVVEH